MRIGELSRRTGVSVRMLRFYEGAGLLAPQRTVSGYRVYTLADVTTVERIRLLGAAGLTLGTIRTFLPCARGEGPTFEPCEELRVMLRDRIRHVDRTIEDLARSRTLLARFVADMDEAGGLTREAGAGAPPRHRKDARSRRGRVVLAGRRL